MPQTTAVVDAARQRELSRMKQVLECELGALIRPDRLRTILSEAVEEVQLGNAEDPARELRLKAGAKVLDEIGRALDGSARASTVTAYHPLQAAEPRPIRLPVPARMRETG